MAHRNKDGSYDVSSTAPHASRKLKTSLLWPFAKLAALVGIPLVLLHVYGQPALRVQYVWNGNNSTPIYHECDYFTAFDGWKTIYPYPAPNNCPLIAFFPFQISDLIGE